MRCSSIARMSGLTRLLRMSLIFLLIAPLGPSPPSRRPGEGRVVLEPVEPAADQGVAHFHAMIQELEGQLPVHRLDPEGQPGQLRGQWIDVHAVEAPLHDVPLQAGLEQPLESLIVRRSGDQFFSQPSRGLPARTEASPRPRPSATRSARGQSGTRRGLRSDTAGPRSGTRRSPWTGRRP